MSISISSRTAVFAAQTKARPGPELIPRPQQEPARVNSPKSGVVKTTASAPSRADFGATIDTQPAQVPPGVAQEEVAPEGGPARDPGLQDGRSMFGDINEDGDLNQEDIFHLLKAFNSSVTAADLNADGNVDASDLGILINAIRDIRGKEETSSQPIRPANAEQIPSNSEQVTSPKFSSIQPGDPLIWAPGGADEPVAQPGVFGDLTGDGILNNDDLEALKSTFGQTNGAGDLNSDGRIDAADLGMLLGAFNRQKNA
jgi:hypothetical protein